MTRISRGKMSLVGHRAANRLAFALKLEQLAQPLAPFVQVGTGRIHPAFPRRLLNFWLLTDAQLEALAHFYHQGTPSRLSREYPCPVRWSSDLPLEEKRRRIGKFIGLRGCESPRSASGATDGTMNMRVLTVEEIEEHARIRRIAEDAEEALFRQKARWY